MTYLSNRVAAIDAMARSRYERLDSHFTMPGGLSWEAYKAEDPVLADLYLGDAAADLDALITSGAVIDASTLADDEAIFAAIYADDQWSEDAGLGATLRALAAALTERGEDRG